MNLYGLIGYPLSHSFSEQYFTEKFARENLTDCIFKAFPITSVHELPALLQNNPSLKGLCVTIPYKEQVIRYVTALSGEVKNIGATNSIKISGNKLIAYNTDITGFEKSFTANLQPHHKKVLVLGTGGASKAVQFVLHKLHLDFLVVSRNAAVSGKLIGYNELTREIMEQHQVIINCTPSGMWPNDSDFPSIPYDLITSQHYVFDLIYKPAVTLFLKKAAERGAITKNGYEMLIIQAEESWKLWNT